MDTQKLLDTLTKRYPSLEGIRGDIEAASNIIIESYENGGKLLTCGNGGSNADADHIVGELMKSFSKKRPLESSFESSLASIDPEKAEFLASHLERGLPAISLSAHAALNTAVSNDIHGDLIFAQQVNGYGQKGDVFLGITTSGNSKNVIYAAIVAKAKGMKVLGLTGETGGELKKYCDAVIKVPAKWTPEVQEYHLPVYHTICQIIEYHFF
jgi:D-sedoheptulose 7-phosphate isomerase